MNEKQKLDEARHFYSQMLKEQSHLKPFYYSLSAFLSAARSVLQYAFDEAKTRQGGKSWYDQRVQSRILGFFRDKRNVNIHTEPVKPSKHVNVRAPTATLSISESLVLVLRDANGNVVERRAETHEPRPTPKSPVNSGEVTTRYTFADWNGPEDVILLCQMYLDELQLFVEDGMREGFLTG